MFISRIFTFISLLIFSCFFTSAWSTEHSSEKPILQPKENKKLNTKAPLLKAIETLKKTKSPLENLFLDISLNDLKSYYKTLQPSDDNFDVFVMIVLKCEQHAHFSALL